MVGKILSFSDTEGRTFVKYIRDGWKTRGFEMVNMDIDSAARVANIDAYRVLVFVMGADHSGKFCDCMKAVRKRTHALIIFIPFQKLSPETESHVLLDGADQIFSLPDIAQGIVDHCITLIRRHEEQQSAVKRPSTMYMAYKFHLYVEQCMVDVDGRDIALENKELALLKYLMENRNIVLTYDQLLEKVWGPEYVGGPRNILWVQIRNIRKKIQWKPSLPQYIVTKQNVGYNFDPHFECMTGKINI